VMYKFHENPILGWGFSSDYYEYRDAHVGHPNILLNTGIVGYIYLNLLFIYFCLIILRMGGDKNIRVHEGTAPLIFLFGLITIYVIHSSSTQYWGYPISIEKILFFSFFFASVNTVYLKYYK
jgi:hypothetical protein